MRLPLQPNLRFTRQLDTGVTPFVPTSYIYNGTVEAGDRPYTVNRPIFETVGDASALGRSDKGRGVYHWLKGGTIYYVNDTQVLYGQNMTVTTGSTLTSGTSKVYFAEVGNYLIITDPGGNEGFYIDSAAPTVVATITDLDFPPNQTPPLQLAMGCAGYKGRAYVMDTDGGIWNSASQDVTSWNGGDNIYAEIDNDNGVYLQKFNNELVAFGSKSIEYFHHTNNPTNSPLSVRQDVFHSIGMPNFATVAETNNSLYFVGHSMKSGRSVYRMTGHDIQRVSRPDFDNYLSVLSLAPTSAADNIDLFASAFDANGRTYYLLTMFYGTDNQTYVYDSLADYWYWWEYTEYSFSGFPIIDWAQAGPNYTLGRAILANGDLIVTTADISFVGTNEPVAFGVKTENQDFGSNKIKFMNDVGLDLFVTNANAEETTQTGRISFYDDGNILVTGNHDIELLDRHIDSAGVSNVVARAGAFRKRSFEVFIPISGTATRAELYNLDFDLREGL